MIPHIVIFYFKNGFACDGVVVVVFGSIWRAVGQERKDGRGGGEGEVKGMVMVMATAESWIG